MTNLTALVALSRFFHRVHVSTTCLCITDYFIFQSLNIMRQSPPRGPNNPCETCCTHRLLRLEARSTHTSQCFRESSSGLGSLPSQGPPVAKIGRSKTGLYPFVHIEIGRLVLGNTISIRAHKLIHNKSKSRFHPPPTVNAMGEGSCSLSTQKFSKSRQMYYPYCANPSPRPLNISEPSIG